MSFISIYKMNSLAVLFLTVVLTVGFLDIIFNGDGSGMLPVPWCLRELN